MTKPVSVIGAGAWGTALAAQAASCGHPVSLWAREPGLVHTMSRSRQNPIYLPRVTLDHRITPTADLSEAGRHATNGAILMVVPAQFIRSVAEALSPHVRPNTPVIVCAKGIETGTGKLMTEVLHDTIPQALPAVLSGPSFAVEVAAGLPTAVVLGCRYEPLDAHLAALLSTERFRVYRSGDLIGVQIGGALKNVAAIACGIVVGLGLGENAKAALIARALAEFARYGKLRGTRPETFMGLSGLGDLVLTCNSEQSRNMSLGLAIGRGLSLADATAQRTGVVEGVATAEAVHREAERMGIDLPICEAVYQVAHEGADLSATIEALLARPVGPETVN